MGPAGGLTRALLVLIALMQIFSFGSAQEEVLVSGGRLVCSLAKLDLVFIVDESSSIWGRDFQTQLSFLANFTSQFDVGPKKSQFAMVTFSDYPRLRWHLNGKTDKKQLLNDIKTVRQNGGGTNTGDAIRYARENMFISSRGGRSGEGISKIGIVITDGESYDAKSTSKESAAARAQGITMYAIGIGTGFSEAELLSIAGTPTQVFTANNFQSLENIRKNLAKKSCLFVKATQPPPPPTTTTTTKAPTTTTPEPTTTTTPEPTTTTTPEPTTTTRKPPPTTPGCSGGFTDVVFVVDESSSIWRADFAQQLIFLQNVTRGFPIGPQYTQVGLLTFSGQARRKFNLNAYTTRQGIITAISDIKQVGGGTNTADAIAFARTEMFDDAVGGRTAANKIAVVITDGESYDKEATVKEAALARADGITMIAIGVGSGFSKDELRSIAGEDDNVFIAKSFTDLEGVRHKLTTRSCIAVTTPEPTTTTTPEPATTPEPTTKPPTKPPPPKIPTKKKKVPTATLR